MHALATLLPLAAAASKKSKSGAGQLLFLPLMLGALYFLVMRPQQKRARAQQQAHRDTVAAALPGDRVVLSTGIYAAVTAADGDRLTLSVSPGSVLYAHRGAISRRIDADDVDAPSIAQLGGTPVPHTASAFDPEVPS